MAQAAHNEPARPAERDDRRPVAILVAGKPSGERIAKCGPFVMSTEAEFRQALFDFRAGRSDLI